MADQESNISLLFKSIEAEFEAYERIDDPKRAEAKLSLLTSMIRDSKGCDSDLFALCPYLVLSNPVSYCNQLTAQWLEASVFDQAHPSDIL